MRELIDLDAARAARAETRDEPPWFVIDGEKFELPAELPAEFAYLLQDPKEALQFLLGDRFEAFWAHHPTNDDLKELVGRLAGAYGMAQGESRASGTPSTNGSRRSRPTSPATTRSISAKPASEPDR